MFDKWRANRSLARYLASPNRTTFLQCLNKIKNLKPHKQEKKLRELLLNLPMLQLALDLYGQVFNRHTISDLQNRVNLDDLMDESGFVQPLLNIIGNLPQDSQIKILSTIISSSNYFVFPQIDQDNVFQALLKLSLNASDCLLDIIALWPLDAQVKVLSHRGHLDYTALDHAVRFNRGYKNRLLEMISRFPEKESEKILLFDQGPLWSHTPLNVAVNYRPESIKCLLEPTSILPESIRVKMLLHRGAEGNNSALDMAIYIGHVHPSNLKMLLSSLSTLPASIRRLALFDESPRGNALEIAKLYRPETEATALLEKAMSGLTTEKAVPSSEGLPSASREVASTSSSQRFSEVLLSSRVEQRAASRSSFEREGNCHAEEPSVPPMPVSTSLQFFNSRAKRLNNSDIVDALNRKGISYDELCDYAESQEKKWQALCCPITHNPFIDPVILGNTGHTFEREAIEAALTRNPDRDPLTNDAISDSNLVPNYVVRDVILQHIEEMPDKSLAVAIGL